MKRLSPSTKVMQFSQIPKDINAHYQGAITLVNSMRQCLQHCNEECRNLKGRLGRAFVIRFRPREEVLLDGTHNRRIESKDCKARLKVQAQKSGRLTTGAS